MREMPKNSAKSEKNSEVVSCPQYINLAFKEIRSFPQAEKNQYEYSCCHEPGNDRVITVIFIF
jgi:hypothetical protein